MAKQEQGIERDWSSVRKGLLTQYQVLPGFRLRGERTLTVAGKKGYLLSVSFRHGSTLYHREQQIAELECPATAPKTCTFDGAAVPEMLGTGQPCKPDIEPVACTGYSQCPEPPLAACSDPDVGYQVDWRRDCFACLETQDADGDGWVYPWDCDESPTTGASRNPDAIEDCSTTNIDEDCDGSATNSNQKERCGDGIDNNCNGKIDYDDSPPFADEICCNGIDDDCDGEIDDGCQPNNSKEICNDGIDNNCDGELNEGCDCDESDPDCCEKQRSKPVNVITGQTYTSPVTDLSVAFPELPLRFERRYIAQPTKDFVAGSRDHTALGPGWSHSFDVRIVQVNASVVIVSGGTRKDVKLDGSGTTFVAPPGRPEIVEQIGNTWVLHRGDGRRWVFDQAGKLVYVASRGNLGLRVERDAQGKVSTVTSYQDAASQTGAGPYLQFQYVVGGDHAGMLEKVELHSGATVKTWTYAYLKAGPKAVPILHKVTYPGAKEIHYDYQVFPGLRPTYGLTRATMHHGTTVTLLEQHQYLTTGVTVQGAEL